MKPRYCFFFGMFVLALGLCGGLAKAAGPKGSFAGTWSTKSETGGDYELVLSVRGVRVAGTFSEKNPKYNGTLKGTVRGNVLNYTFKQTVTGGTGHGGWLLLSGAALPVASSWMPIPASTTADGNRTAAQTAPTQAPSAKIEDGVQGLVHDQRHCVLVVSVGEGGARG